MSRHFGLGRVGRVGTTLLALVLIASLVAPGACFAWGESAERLIANKAIDTLPDEMLGFFSGNRRFLVGHVSDPVENESRNPAEQRYGFIQLDHYGQFPFTMLPRSYAAALAKYSRKTLETYGLLPWEIGIYSQKLTMALRDRNWEEAKMNAALLAHYVAAAHDPFNTTVNSDGKLSDQPGVNERFSTVLVDRYQLFIFVKPNEAAFVRDPTNQAFEMTLGAHAWLDNVLLEDRRAHEGLTGYTDEFYDRFYAQAGAILIRQLSDASTDVGSYWMTAWINAGRPPLPSP
jgi:hypothetical protein